MIKIRPINNKIVIQRDRAENKHGSIYLPETAKEKPVTATVIACGPGEFNKSTGSVVPMSVKIGDKIIINKWGGSEIKIGTQEYLIITENEVLGVVENG